METLEAVKIPSTSLEQARLSDFQHTLDSPFSVSGKGLHTGLEVNLKVLAAPANTGIIFKRIDLDGFLIEALPRNVARVSYATSLMKKGVLISTTEHLLSALSASGVDNAVLEIDNLEVPILDGSAAPFVRLIGQAGIRRQRAQRLYAKVLRPVEVIHDGKRLGVYPTDHFMVSYQIAFPHPVIGEQKLAYDPQQDNYETQIAPARTFGFLEEAEKLRRAGLIRGGSMENAIVLSREGVLNPEGLRFPDEFCRHKILDLLGDLSLLGHPLIGHVVAERAGHAMHYALVARLLRERDAWTLLSPRQLASAGASGTRPSVAVGTVI